MSNEELAERIRDGEKELIPELWDGVKGFIHQQAFRYFRRCPGRGGTELEDLVQSSFIAMMNAVEHYTKVRGCGFLTFLDFYLLHEFRKCFGIYAKRPDPLNGIKDKDGKFRLPRSLDEPIAEDRGDGILADTVPDPRDQYETAERRMWLEQLKAALDAAMDQLPGEQRTVLENRYYKKMTLEGTAAATGTDKRKVQQLERSGLEQLRKQKHKNGLEQFIDQRTDFYNYVSVNTFNTTHSSAVEKAVIMRDGIRNSMKRKEEK